MKYLNTHTSTHHLEFDLISGLLQFLSE